VSAPEDTTPTDPEDATPIAPEDATPNAPEKTLQPLLLHSLSELREIWLPLIELADVRSATEIGSESGVTSRLLIERLHDAGGGRLTIIDPGAVEVSSPADVEREIIRGFSPAALEGLHSTDLYLIDGDHNYWTVSSELQAISAASKDRDHFPLLLLNDVSWPAARRDQYYDPTRLPPEAVHPHSYELGAVPGERLLKPSGFRGEGSFAYALEEGGPRNGVLTAVEHFLSERSELELHIVAPVFGLGVIVDRAAPWIEPARELLAPYAGSAFLARLEDNRTRLYVRIIELQDALGALESSSVRARRGDALVSDRALSAASTRDLELREQLADLERELASTRSELVDVRAQLAAASVPIRPSPTQRVLGWLRSRG
jgi:hypothetical protein